MPHLVTRICKYMSFLALYTLVTSNNGNVIEFGKGWYLT